MSEQLEYIFLSLKLILLDESNLFSKRNLNCSILTLTSIFNAENIITKKSAQAVFHEGQRFPLLLFAAETGTGTEKKYNFIILKEKSD